MFYSRFFAILAHNCQNLAFGCLPRVFPGGPLQFQAFQGFFWNFLIFQDSNLSHSATREATHTFTYWGHWPSSDSLVVKENCAKTWKSLQILYTWLSKFCGQKFSVAKVRSRFPCLTQIETVLNMCQIFKDFFWDFQKFSIHIYIVTETKFKASKVSKV